MIDPPRSPAEQIAALGGGEAGDLLNERRRRFELGLVPIPSIAKPAAAGDLLAVRREALRAVWAASRLSDEAEVSATRAQDRPA